MIFRRPKRFADYLIWECLGRALGAGLIAAAGFLALSAPAFSFGAPEAAVAFAGLSAGWLDAMTRHRRFYTDFELIRQLEAVHRGGGWLALVEGDLLVWNGVYAANFLVGLGFAIVGADAVLAGGLTEAVALRSIFLYAAVFYFSNAGFWRALSHGRALSFLTKLKVDFAEHVYARKNVDPAGD